MTRALEGREHLTLSLLGETHDVLRRGSDWVARHDATDLLLREQPNGTWILTDVLARTWRFTNHATWGLWLLESIEAPGNGGRVHLDYAIQPLPRPGRNCDLDRSHPASLQPAPDAGELLQERNRLALRPNTITAARAQHGRRGHGGAEPRVGHHRVFCGRDLRRHRNAPSSLRAALRHHTEILRDAVLEQETAIFWTGAHQRLVAARLNVEGGIWTAEQESALVWSLAQQRFLPPDAAPLPVVATGSWDWFANFFSR